MCEFCFMLLGIWFLGPKRRRKTEKEKEENIWRRNKSFYAEEKKNWSKWREILGEGKIFCFWEGEKRRRKEEKYLEKKKSFAEDEKKGGKHMFLWGRKKRRRKRRKIFGEGKYLFVEAKKNWEGKSIWGRQTEWRDRARILHSDLQYMNTRLWHCSVWFWWILPQTKP